MSTSYQSSFLERQASRKRPRAEWCSINDDVTSSDSSDEDCVASRNQDICRLLRMHGVEEVKLANPLTINNGSCKSSSNCFVRCHAGLSLGGYNSSGVIKNNQDSIIMAEDPATKSLLYVCMDGHGRSGDKVSQYVRDELKKRLFASEIFATNIEGAIRLVLCQIEMDLFHETDRYGDLSGTTLSLAVVRGKKVTVANIGDSRIVLVKRNSSTGSKESSNTDSGNDDSTDSWSSEEDSSVNSRFKRRRHGVQVHAEALTVDHKPDLREEYERICARGGRVFSVRFPDGVVGPPRVWLGTANSPGLAMSRSLGDFLIHTVGVISTPDVFEYDLDGDEDVSLVVATDGLWDQVTNQEVAEITAAFPCQPHRAVAQLVATARARWQEKERMSDDITACVVSFKCEQ